MQIGGKYNQELMKQILGILLYVCVHVCLVTSNFVNL